MDVSKPSAPHRWVVYDIDFKTGRIRWEREVRTGVPAKSRHLKNSYAAETPVTDGERVYVYFGDVGLFAFDMDGKPVWSRPMDAFEMQTGFGHAKSPVVDDRHVYIVNDNEEHSFIAAYDKRTGDQVWRVDRKETSNWTTPLVWKNEQRTEIVTAATGGVRSLRCQWQAALAAHGDVDVRRAESVRGQWSALCHVGVFGQLSATGVRDPSWSDGRHLAEDGRDEQRLHRVGGSHARDVSSVSAGVPGLLLRAARSRLSDVQRSGDRQGDLSTAAHQYRHGDVHGLTVGLQRQGVRAQRGRRHVRVSGGA